MKKILTLIMAVVMIAALAAPIFAVDKVDTISGNLTVTSFFNEKTNAVELKSGDSYTFKFHNKSTGDAWPHNYILAITGAIGDAYKDKEQEILIIRADRWGWGGGMSDFQEPNGKDHPISFTDNLNNDFDTWYKAMQAGLDVEIVLSRTGDTIKYDAKMGDYTMSLEATSGKALPESAYVFLTGEKVELTNISTTKNVEDAPTTDTPTTDAPTTGDTPTTGEQGGQGGQGGNAPATGFATAAIAIVAISSGAYIVSKKRK